KLIRTYSSEVKMLNEKIQEDGIVINAMQQDLDNLKKEYASMVYSMYKSSNGFNRLSFIFASSNLSQFYMRFKYLEQYASARKNQVKLISEIKAELGDEKATFELAKDEKNVLLSEQMKEKKTLDKLKSEQDKVFTNLKNEESKLTKDIAKKKNEVSKLENLISKLLKEEIKSTASATKEVADLKIDLKNISSLFEKNKSNLPWPVASGFISEKFGTHPHPVLKRIKMPSDGVNIQTKQNEQVRAVFNGVVKKIAIVPGEFKYVVIVQHGSYFTVYAKLKEVSVKMGQQIAKNDVIGEVNTDVDGVSEVQFQVWKNTQKLDPELWLAKK
ncbi:MAG: peptidoglycan DD-metalloendopeptidase family protein, partial [Cyclobacteriaceae bacterium]|nr:peptidoglycan DD-metalloendopeptidase family protein [Cyclobacteriaceae bacterium]